MYEFETPWSSFQFVQTVYTMRRSKHGDPMYRFLQNCVSFQIFSARTMLALMFPFLLQPNKSSLWRCTMIHASCNSTCNYTCHSRDYSGLVWLRLARCPLMINCSCKKPVPSLRSQKKSCIEAIVLSVVYIHSYICAEFFSSYSAVQPPFPRTSRVFI